jgi:hypothetical protein
MSFKIKYITLHLAALNSTDDGCSLPVRQPAAVSYSTPSRAQYEESLRQAAMSSPHLRTAEDSDRMWAADQPREEK